MLVLKIYGEEVQCDRVEKSADGIKIYLNGQVVQEDSGISDFSGYILADDQGNPAEFSVPASENNSMEVAIKAVVTAMAGTGNLPPSSAEMVINKALEIVHG